MLVDPDTTVLLPAVTSREVAIKRAVSKLRFDGHVADLGEKHRFQSLPVTHAHAARVEQLPDLHRDPIDRPLVAQAQLGEAMLVTRDAAIAAYDVATLRC